MYCTPLGLQACLVCASWDTVFHWYIHTYTHRVPVSRCTSRTARTNQSQSHSYGHTCTLEAPSSRSAPYLPTSIPSSLLFSLLDPCCCSLSLSLRTSFLLTFSLSPSSPYTHTHLSPFLSFLPPSHTPTHTHPPLSALLISPPTPPPPQHTGHPEAAEAATGHRLLPHQTGPENQSVSAPPAGPAEECREVWTRVHPSPQRGAAADAGYPQESQRCHDSQYDMWIRRSHQRQWTTHHAREWGLY